LTKSKDFRAQNFEIVKLAAIDIGSNAIRLMITRVLSGGKSPQLKRLEFIRIPLRLGDDVFQQRFISPQKEAQLTKAIQSFKLIMDVHQVADYTACATSAMRDAMNGVEIAERIKKSTGISIEIIDGMRESALILDSVMKFFPDNGDFLNIDVGGGSTEMTVIHDHKPVKSQSFNIGTVRLLYGSVNEEEWTRMERWVEDNAKLFKGLIAVGTGGNINKAFRMMDLGDRESMSYDKLKALYTMVKNMSLRERIYKLKLNPDRADVLEPALKIHLTIMKWVDIKKIYAPNAGLKDGIIEELLKKNQLLVAE
jgi:exopolyphosphatase/guanosine-5'-triphosphate,3'-diphosphate pyrophosphatase